MKRYLLTALTAICGAVAAYSQQVDSLERRLRERLADTVRLQVLSELVWQTSSDTAKAGAYAREQLALALRLGEPGFLGQAWNDVGIIQIRQNSFKQALLSQQKALEARLKAGNPAAIASSYSKIAYCYAKMSDYLAALEPAMKALDIYEKTGNKVYQAYSLNTLCNIYSNLQMFDQLEASAQKSLRLAKEMNNQEGIGAALMYISNTFESRADYKEGIKYQQLALEAFAQIPDSGKMASCLNNLGFMNMKSGNTQAAIKYYQDSYSIHKKTNNVNSLAKAAQNLGSTYLSLGKLNEAFPYLEESLRLATQQDLKDQLVLSLRSMGDYYALSGQPKEAIRHYDHASGLKDSLFSKEVAEKLTEMEVKYETQKKIDENRVLQSENAAKTAQLSRSRVIQISLAGALLLVLVLSYLVYVRFKLKQKQRLAEEMLRQQELRAKAVIEAEEKERIRIARELHDGIGQQLSAAKMNISSLEGAIQVKSEQEKSMLRNALDLLDESVKEVRAVSHSMMPNALMKSGLVSAVREFINKISSAGNLKINLEIVGMDRRLDHTAENVLFRVWQEIVNNIIKHAGASEVSIQFIQHESELTVLVEDNGRGFNVEEMLNREDAGIGLKNIQSRVEYLNGKVFFDSYPGKGTTVTIEVPLAMPAEQ